MKWNMVRLLPKELVGEVEEVFVGESLDSLE